MVKQIALFNHKGGVSKTTTTFNLGWMLASKGKRVLLVDCDPQCNLTGLFFGDTLEAQYAKQGIRNIRDGLAPAFESKPVAITYVECDSKAEQPNLFMLPGHIKLAEYETTLGVAQELSGSIVTLQNLPGSIFELIQKTANQYNIDLVLYDMSPSLGPINQNILMTSDYFVVPMAPDYFSLMAIDSLASILPKWKRWAVAANQNQLLKEAAYPMPECNPKYIGTVIQKYRLRKGEPAAAFQVWIDKIMDKVLNTLIPALTNSGMLLDEVVYTDAKAPTSQPIMRASDYNSLIGRSQEFNVPIFELTDEQLGLTGTPLANTKEAMAVFKEAYSQTADRIITIVDHA